MIDVLDANGERNVAGGVEGIAYYRVANAWLSKIILRCNILCASEHAVSFLTKLPQISQVS